MLVQVDADPPKCTITAGTFVGAIYALETLSQLVLSEGGGLYGSAPPRHVGPCLNISNH